MNGELDAMLEFANSLSLIGFMLIALRYVDSLRREEKQESDDRTNDIVEDWKRMRNIDS